MCKYVRREEHASRGGVAVRARYGLVRPRTQPCRCGAQGVLLREVSAEAMRRRVFPPDRFSNMVELLDARFCSLPPSHPPSRPSHPPSVLSLADRSERRESHPPSRTTSHGSRPSEPAPPQHTRAQPAALASGPAALVSREQSASVELATS
uniref:Uncharacterized protein n=1 Tax=Calcidiscus leptoporus TaxID=127549 RepID=A0A7S0NU30_9EUKA|mmetsp:Transcript_26368/g.61512  ORF Transcript_26368/g.61512 Transcript_26368/m.61512 type:complete len:151 (+) Transcript_26368:93-545(+)